jgi:site-specific DNA recombinase
VPGLSSVRCAVYARQSVVPRPGDAELSSCSLQREACLRFIDERREQGWVPLAERFEDEGESGASLERPGLRRLVAAVHRGEVDRVVVYRIDRLSRNVAQWAELTELFEAHGASLGVVCGALLREGGPMARLQGSMLACFAELERTMTRERIADTRTALRARGLRSAGRVPFGYTAERKQLVIHTDEALVVREIFVLAARGVLPAQIALDLNARPLAARGGKPGEWQARTILRLLRNPVYLGKLPDGSPGAHPALIEPDLAAKAIASIDERRTRQPAARPGHGRRDPFLLRGLLICSRCGRAMTTSSSGKIHWPSRQESPWGVRAPSAYYRCRGASSCAGSQQSAPEIERYVLDVVKSPPGGSPPLLTSFGRYFAGMWELLMPQNRPPFLRRYVRAIRLDPEASEVRIEYDLDALMALVHERNRRLGGAAPSAGGSPSTAPILGAPETLG